MKGLIKKIKESFHSESLSNIAKFVVGWIILFDTVGGTAIPLVYHNSCGWFAIPNLVIDIYVIYVFIKRINDEGTR